ncbi:FAS-associated death domain protein [Chaetodon auriga]|uniref:FAS-associated death domain protein n=1 Tax=Chaetodon auriga TaxID=39042 RepID=UPI004032CE41
MSSLQFNAVLLEISNQLSAEQLEQIKFLCRDMIRKRELETIDTGRKLFNILTERGRLGADNKECLCELLREIQRHDLSDKLNRFESQSGSTDNQPDDEEKAKLDIATEVISENLGKSWRKLGRKLGLTDVKLESIYKRHPTELEEMAVELLKEWRKIRGAEARTEELIKALRACQYNLTADKVEHRLATR